MPSLQPFTHAEHSCATLVSVWQVDSGLSRRWGVFLCAPTKDSLAATGPEFHIQLDTISTGFDRQTCWVHARAGAIPGNPPSVVLTTQKLLLTGSDVFYALHDMRTDDLGKSWSVPREHACE